MRFWPFRKPERREAGGDYTQTIVQFAEAQAAGSAADAGRTAAVEAASGLLSRAFSGAVVDGPDWVVEAVNPVVLAQAGRDLIRRGEYLAALRMDETGQVQLVTCSDFWWHGGDAHRSSWNVRCTAYGPSSSHTWYLPESSVVFLTWGSHAGSMYRGQSPVTWASVTSRLSAEAERSLADESAGPIAQLLPIPTDGGDGGDDDPLAMLKADVAKARGKALLIETTADSWGDGRTAAPKKDWIKSRLGPDMPASMVDVAQQSFERVLAATGTPPSLFTDSDGTSQREAIRRWHLGTVIPLAKQLEWELSRKLETPVKLKFDSYPRDMVSRAQVFAKLASAEGLSTQQAMEIAGLLDE